MSLQLFSLLLCAASANGCFSFCDKFNTSDLIASCKAGCVFHQATAQRPVLVRRNEDPRERAKTAQKILDNWCVDKFGPSWSACGQAIFNFNPRYGTYCHCDSYFVGDPDRCQAGCEKVRELWDDEPWDQSYFNV